LSAVDREKMMATILVVDDDDDIRRFFVQLLGRAGHEVVEACDGADALRKAAAHQPDLVISDLLMPAMDGFELVRLLRSESTLEETAVIFYTATFVQQEALDLARACGAIYVVQKPCRSELLLRTVTEALKRPALACLKRLDQAEFHSSHLSLLTNTLRQKVTELADANRDLAAAYDATLEGWVRALDLRDKETEGHSQRVSRVTVRLARAVGFDDPDLVHIRRGALLHDIGKLAVSDLLLLKPGPLTATEREGMERHPELAYDMLLPIDYLRQALDIPYCHHEKWDGSGYPRGLRGEEIPLSARLFAVVDVWDALSSERPYRTAWSSLDVNEYLFKQQGTQFDPRAVEQFLSRPELASCESRPTVLVRPPHFLAAKAPISDKPARQVPVQEGDDLAMDLLP
jgi:putative two-component system response regulator